ncbi:MAG: TRAM domain-containing protein, partial [bacterium]|nr:TRAM domain-containing protein [bacterium]
PGTAAFKMVNNVLKAEKKIREEKLMQILRKTAFDNNKKYVGKIVKVLVEGKNKRNELYGSTETAKTVKILTGDFNQRLPRRSAPRNDKSAGKFALIKIKTARDFGLEGELTNYEKGK